MILVVAEAGDLRRGLLKPKQTRLNVREEMTCPRCGRAIIVWRDPGRELPNLRCNGEWRFQCGRLATAINEASQAARSEATRPERQEAKRAKKAAARARRRLRLEEERLAAERAGPEAEALRLSICPRPDKEVWLTREAAEYVIRLMRAEDRPDALDLHAYDCPCGVWHVGNRMAAPEPQRWPSAYESDPAFRPPVRDRTRLNVSHTLA